MIDFNKSIHLVGDIQLLEYPIPPPLSSVTKICVQWISGTEQAITDPLVLFLSTLKSKKTSQELRMLSSVKCHS